jgi:hypothetical protein|tara:strand:- start:648 stop:1079 length:432 start_codon:yes stop_codon:yes gene_type:complete
MEDKKALDREEYLKLSRDEKGKYLTDSLPDDSFIAFTDENIIIEFTPAARDMIPKITDYLLKDLNDQEKIAILMKCNTDPETWKENGITLNELERLVYFTLDLFHTLGFSAIDSGKVHNVTPKQKEELVSNLTKSIIDKSNED